MAKQKKSEKTLTTQKPKSASKSVIPPCPDGGDAGIKHPDVIEWNRKYNKKEFNRIYHAMILKGKLEPVK